MLQHQCSYKAYFVCNLVFLHHNRGNILASYWGTNADNSLFCMQLLLVFWNYVYDIPWSFPHQNTSESYMLCKVFSLDRVYGSVYWFVNYSLNVGSVPWPKAHLGWGGAGHFCWKYKFVLLWRESLRYDWSRPPTMQSVPPPLYETFWIHSDGHTFVQM